MGKNASTAAMTTFGVRPNPNQTTNSGTSATFGTTCVATMKGFNIFSARGILPRSAPRPTPMMVAKKNPRIVSQTVIQVWSHMLGRVRLASHSIITRDGGGRINLLTLKTRT
jgi:hypothetical protein